jgi:hypothetical protein
MSLSEWNLRARYQSCESALAEMLIQPDGSDGYEVPVFRGGDAAASLKLASGT